MRISQIAEQVACPVQTIRFYEQQGLLPRPARTTGNYRVYTSAHAVRLRFIRHCRSLDMSLEEIRQLLKLCDTPRESCEEVNAFLDEHMIQVARRIAALRALEAHLKELRRLCRTARHTQNCAILRELTATAGSTADRAPPFNPATAG